VTRYNTPTRPADAGALAPTTAFIKEMYGQDLALRAGSQDDSPPFRFADTDVLDRADLLTILIEARTMQQRELGRLFAAPVVWLVKTVVRWNERNILRRRLQELPDYMLKDIGIRRDQIDAVVSGDLKREPSKVETAIDASQIRMAA
jgi:uncharacterized protein YjiS (DUF1127 family)